MNSPNNGEVLKLNDCVMRFRARKELTATLKQTPLLTLVLPQDISKTVQDRLISFQMKWLTRLKVNKNRWRQQGSFHAVEGNGVTAITQKFVNVFSKGRSGPHNSERVVV